MNAEVEELELVLGLHSRSGSSQAKYQAKYLELVGYLSSWLDVLPRRESAESTRNPSTSGVDRSHFGPR